MKPLPHSFFNRPTDIVAYELIGCYLVGKRGGKIERFMITETEAYHGFEDEASHAFRGQTARNEIMFRSAGHIYVYFTYGMHWLLNIVTGEVGHPSAALIRGLENVDDKSNARLDGPARLTKALGIDKNLNGQKLSKKTGLWIEGPAQGIDSKSIKRTPRIGIAYAGPKWVEKKWRFVLKEK